MEDHEVVWFLTKNLGKIDAIIGKLKLHEFHTGHTITKVRIAGKEEYMCECGIWDISKIMAEAE